MKQIYRILVNGSPYMDYETKEQAQREFKTLNERGIELVVGHWQGSGDFTNFKIDQTIV